MIIKSKRTNCSELTTAGSAPMALAVKTISTRPPGAKHRTAVANDKGVRSEKRYPIPKQMEMSNKVTPRYTPLYLPPSFKFQ